MFTSVFQSFFSVGVTDCNEFHVDNLDAVASVSSWYLIEEPELLQKLCSLVEFV